MLSTTADANDIKDEESSGNFHYNIYKQPLGEEYEDEPTTDEFSSKEKSNLRSSGDKKSRNSMSSFIEGEKIMKEKVAPQLSNVISSSTAISKYEIDHLPS